MITQTGHLCSGGQAIGVGAGRVLCQDEPVPAEPLAAPATPPTLATGRPAK